MRPPEFDYESMTGLEFQALVSALVVREFPRAQCMPLHGRDGGRDVIVQEVVDGQFRDNIIFQVKMKERSETGVPTTKDLYEWVVEHVNREVVKQPSLISRGMTEYVLVTNIPASGDMHKGLRDQVSRLLADKIQVKSRVLWREDLNTRLRAHPDVALAHGLLVGDSTLRSMLSDRGIIAGSEADVITRAMLSYCTVQYTEDSVLRFSQVDLDPVPLLNMFVDVPMTLKRPKRARPGDEWTRSVRVAYSAMRIHKSSSSNVEIPQFHEYSAAPGAADLILHGHANIFDRAMIEGAPGQGKTTISQYVCQVYRAQLLGKKEDLKRIGSFHQSTPFRMPFRVELRKYASWLSARESGDVETGLLAYIANLVSESVDIAVEAKMIVAVLCGTRSIIMLDGLDEVAEATSRLLVIDKINKLSENLRTWNAEARVVVTTRPSMIAPVGDIESLEFANFTLANLRTRHITKYAGRWYKIKSLSSEKKFQINSILMESLKSRHVADLARNAMQLAILLYLIQIRGRSLPQKRTALYHSYIQAFQSRESDKSLPVSEYGDLLLDLHGYVAWILHCRSELGSVEGTRGEIEKPELQEIVADYLEFEGYQRNLVRNILDGVQRFFMLVERNEGYFEFEVQPLREFFAARHLYTTSPQVPTVEVPAGTRPDRLAALLHNPYWLNVLRFFAGHYQKGELADLVRQMEDLADSSKWGAVAYPYNVMRMVLQDYSTYQSRRDTSAVARRLMHDLGSRLVARGFETLYWTGVDPITLSDDTGRREIVEAARNDLKKELPPEVLRELAEIISVNDLDPTDWWRELWLSQAADRDFMLGRFGVTTGALAKISVEEALAICESSGNSMWFRLIEAGRADVLEALPERSALAIQKLLKDGHIATLAVSRQSNWVAALPRLLTTRTSGLYVDDQSADHTWFNVNKAAKELEKAAEGLADSEIKPFVELTARLSRLLKDRGSSYYFFKGAEKLVSDLVADSWAAWRFALLSVRGNQKYPEVENFFDPAVLPSDRLETLVSSRFNLDYCVKIASSTKMEDGDSMARRMAFCAAMLCWAPPAVLMRVLPIVDKWWSKLTPLQMVELESCINSVDDQARKFVRKKSRLLSKTDLEALRGLTPSLRVFLGIRVRAAERRYIINSVLADTRTHSDVFVDSAVIAPLSIEFVRRPSRDLLEEIRIRFATALFSSALLEGSNDWISPSFKSLAKAPDLVEEVLRKPRAYPWRMLMMANHVASSWLASDVISLRTAANSGDWFEHDADK